MTFAPVALYKKTRLEFIVQMQDLISKHPELCEAGDEQLAKALGGSVFDVAACREVLLEEDELSA